ncbi:MAG: GNAT family N-acetyltransferase [Candidatus Fischerbacteria bacterium RBG_13_37_8]|uniref:GNAT family N-acetyltransferase n=1 Tax=Candidatus Fischerbacteria bacterium RBG_13_37_8 TaxID=1817863 RepID=A0A1F5VTS1_9BACT|nr:MAG: GNAT family N-acetyltransferase [Candidatus Fischerbacteria bacterium RBG_13_37_8]
MTICNEKKYHERKNTGITIRLMELQDLHSVFLLGEKLFTSEFTPNLYRTWDEQELVSLYLGDEETCLVAAKGKRIIGFALGTIVYKTHSAWSYGYLVWLGVERAYQREGLATRLFNQFRNVMLEEGVRMLLVDTQADNEPALKFFRKVGFGNPEEHVYMTLNLTEKQKQRKVKAKLSHKAKSYIKHNV